MSNLKKRISSPKNKFKGKSFQMKINGKFISLDPDNNYAEFEFTKAKWSWFFFLEQIHNIRGKWIRKVTPKLPVMVKGQIVMKYYSDDFSYLVDTEGMHNEILNNHPFQNKKFYEEANLKSLLKEAGYIDRTVDKYIEESDKYFNQIAKGEIKPYKDRLHKAGWLDKDGNFNLEKV